MDWDVDTGDLIVRQVDEQLFTTGSNETDTVDDVSSWRRRLRQIFFARAHRALEKKKNPTFAQLDKTPDWFEYTSLLIITCNMVILALDDPTTSAAVGNDEVAMSVLDYVFLAFYIIELTLRVLAFGTKMIFKSKWNLLDAFVVVAGILGVFLRSVLPELGSVVSGLRALRILRPLRVIVNIRDVRIVMTTVSTSLRILLDVGLLFLLFWVMVSAWGVNLFKGSFENRCVRNSFIDDPTRQLEMQASPLLGTPASVSIPAAGITVGNPITLLDMTRLSNMLNTTDYVCNGRYDTILLGIERKDCGETMLCDPLKAVELSAGTICPYEYTCQPMGDPYYGFMSFNNVGLGMLTVITLLSFEGWSDILYATMESNNTFAALFCAFSVIVGSMFLTNLLVALLTMQFERCRESALEAEVVEYQMRSAKKRIKVRQLTLRERFTTRLDLSLLGIVVRQELVLLWRGLDDATKADLSGPCLEDSSLLYDTLRMKVPLSSRPAFPYMLDLVRRGRIISCGKVPDDAEEEGRERAPHEVSKELTFISPISHKSVVLFGGDAVEATRQGSAHRLLLQAIFNQPPSRFERFRVTLQRISSSLWFDWFMFMATCLGVGAQCVQYVGMPQDVEYALNYHVSYALAAIYTIESVVRLTGYGWVGMWDVKSQALLPLTTIAEWTALFLAVPEVACCRSLRLVPGIIALRVFPTQFRWFDSVAESFQASVVLLSMLFLDAFLVACVGIQVFGGKYCGLLQEPVTPLDLGAILWSPSTAYSPNCAGRPRENFDSFGNAYLTAFQLVAGDNWPNMMYWSMEAVDSQFTQGFVALLYVLHLFAAVYVLMNMFVAIVLGATKSLYDDEADFAFTKYGGVQIQNTIESFERKVENMWSQRPKLPFSRAENQKSAERKILEDAWLAEEEEKARLGHDIMADIDEEELNAMGVRDDSNNVFVVNAMSVSRTLKCYLRKNAIMRQVLPFHVYVRRVLQSACDTRLIHALTLATTIGIVSLAFLDVPNIAPDDPLRKRYRQFSRVATGVFVFEVLFNIVAKGPVAFIKENKLSRPVEIALASLGIVEGVFDYVFDHNLNVLAVKSLYVVKLLSYTDTSEAFQVLARTLLYGAKPFMNATIVVGLVYVSFTSMGIVLFRNKLSECSIGGLSDVECVAQGGTWSSGFYNFDSFGQALLTLFTVGTLEGWAAVMYRAVDFNGIGQAPVENNSAYYAVYFITFVCIGGFCAMNLFGSVFIQTYEKQVDTQRKMVLLSSSQEQWLRHQSRIISSLPLEEFLIVDAATARQLSFSSRLRILINRIVSHIAFTRTMAVVSTIGALSGLVDFYPSPPLLDTTLFVVNTGVFVVLVMECALRIYVYGLRLYLAVHVNKLELFVAVGLGLDMFIRLVYPVFSVGVLFRFLRLLRAVREGKAQNRVRDLVLKLAQVVISLGTVLFIFGTFVGTMGSLSRYLYASLERDGSVLTSTRNYETFETSVLLWLSTVFGSQWGDLLEACSRTTPDCNPQIGNCGARWVSPFFFVGVVIVGTYILLGLFIAVIIEAFGFVVDEGDVLTAEAVTSYLAAWMCFDSTCRLRIHGRHFTSFLRRLPAGHPLRPEGFDDAPGCESKILACSRKIVLFENGNGDLDFVDVLLELLRLQRNRAFDSSSFMEYRRLFLRQISTIISVRDERDALATGNTGDTGTTRHIQDRMVVEALSMIWIRNKEVIRYQNRKDKLIAQFLQSQNQREDVEVLAVTDTVARDEMADHKNFQLYGGDEEMQELHRATDPPRLSDFHLRNVYSANPARHKADKIHYVALRRQLPEAHALTKEEAAALLARVDTLSKPEIELLTDWTIQQASRNPANGLRIPAARLTAPLRHHPAPTTRETNACGIPEISGDDL